MPFTNYQAMPGNRALPLLNTGGFWNGAIANSNVAADVSPLIIPAGEKFEPTHVGCYTFRMPQGKRGAGRTHEAVVTQGVNIGLIYLPVLRFGQQVGNLLLSAKQKNRVSQVMAKIKIG